MLTSIPRNDQFTPAWVHISGSYFDDHLSFIGGSAGGVKVVTLGCKAAYDCDGRGVWITLSAQFDVNGKSAVHSGKFLIPWHEVQGILVIDRDLDETEQQMDYEPMEKAGFGIRRTE